MGEIPLYRNHFQVKPKEKDAILIQTHFLSGKAKKWKVAFSSLLLSSLALSYAKVNEPEIRLLRTAAHFFRVGVLKRKVTASHSSRTF